MSLSTGNAQEHTAVARSYLPAFASQENRQLDEDVRNLELQLQRTDVDIKGTDQRIQGMAEHLQDVQSELKYMHQRYDGKKKELETEDHLKKISSREQGRFENDVDKLKREQTELSNKQRILQTNIVRGNEQMEQFKLVMNWNQEEFEQWDAASKQKEDDNMALEKYARQDEARIKDLTLTLEKTSKEAQTRKRELESEITETQAAQTELDAVAEDFRRLHVERQALLSQAEAAMANLRKRDEDIRSAGLRFASTKDRLEGLKQALDVQAEGLTRNQEANQRTENQVDGMDREKGRLREAYQTEQQRLSQVLDDVELVKNTLGKTSDDLAHQTSTNGQLRVHNTQKRSELEKLEKQFKIADQKLSSEGRQLDTLEHKVERLDNMREAEEQKLASLEQQMKRLKTEQFKKGQVLFGLREQEKELSSELSGGQAQSKNLGSKLNQLGDEAMKQEESLYQVEFQLQMMERKVAHAKGARSDEETKALHTRISQQTEILEHVNNEHILLTAQLKRAEDDLGHARRKSTDNIKERNRMEDAITALHLEAELTLRSIKHAVKEKEGKMVEADVLAVELKRLRLALSAHADKVFGLEHRKSQLRLGMEERLHQIQLHKEALQAELKLVREDLHRVSLELGERTQRAEKLHAKFDIIAGSQTGPDGEVHSQAYFVVKAAQEREELQRQGDQLNKDVQRAETEVAGLQAALMQLAGSNLEMSAGLKRPDSKAVSEQKAALKGQLNRAYDALRLKRQEQVNMQEDITSDEAHLDNLRAEAEKLHGVVESLLQRKMDGERQVEEQTQKTSRAKRRADKLRRDIQAKDPAAKIGEDVDLAQVHDMNRAMLKELGVLAASHPAAGIAERLESMGIKPLSANTSPRSTRSSQSGSISRAGSVRSSISARSSLSGSLATHVQTISLQA
ncbi:hypothetical protein WJX74_008779 [Apatococcus lobatus]|uniref:Uncharacterized protein n=1 Tax=Apatococcus lobatus TaxID=904363 RepID=A0AAW1SC40_9CHLO